MIIAMKPRALLSLLLSASLLCSPLAAQADALALPDLGDASQTTLSPQAEQKLGRQIMAMIRESGEMLDDPEVELYLNQLGRRLSSASPITSSRFLRTVSGVMPWAWLWATCLARRRSVSPMASRMERVMVSA